MYLTYSQGRPEFELNFKLGRTLRSKKIQDKEMNHKEREGEQLRPRLFGELFEPRFDVMKGTLEVEAKSYQIPPQAIGLIQ